MNKNTISIVLIILGAGLAFWGYQLSGSLSAQLSSALTGSPSDQVMMYYIAGGLSFALGMFMYLKK